MHGSGERRTPISHHELIIIVIIIITSWLELELELELAPVSMLKFVLGLGHGFVFTWIVCINFMVECWFLGLRLQGRLRSVRLGFGYGMYVARAICWYFFYI